MFINSINHYRAIAILFIVAGHTFEISDLKLNSFFENVIGNLINGGTINFVFISGFLFYSIFYKRFKYRHFLKSKMKRILLPYLFLSIVPIIIRLYLVPDFWSGVNSDGVNFWEYILSSLKYLITGSHLIAYWYIPFVILLFLMSPLHIKFIQLKLTNQVLFLILLAVVSLFIHRPSFNRVLPFQAIHSLMYFTPVYLFGSLCSKYKDDIYRILKNKEMLLLAIVVGLAGSQTYLGYNGTYQHHLNEIDGVVDLMFIQKIVMCLFFMVWLNRHENYSNIYIDILAKISFPIYFLHGYVLYFIRSVIVFFNTTFDYPWVMFLIFVSVLVIICVLTAVLIEKVFPKYSIMLIGYGKKRSKAEKKYSRIKARSVLDYSFKESV